MDLGFELQGNFNVVFVNEFHKAFNDVYQYARQQMGIAQPVYGHHVEDITECTDGEHEEKLANLIELVNESKHTDYRLSVYVRIVSALRYFIEDSAEYARVRQRLIEAAFDDSYFYNK